MSKISGGVRIGGFVSPSDSLDTYPTHKSEYGFGGHREVIDLTSRDAITNDRRSEGMTVWVISENKEYRLIGGIANSNWQEVTTGSGSSDPVEWADINNKPNKFTPDTHTHVSTEITDLDVTINSNSNVSANTNARHTHTSLSSVNKINEDVNGIPTWDGNVWPGPEWTNVKNKPTSFTPSTHSHLVAEITDLATSFPIDWANVQNKPTSFTPDTHTHVSTEITDLDVTKFVRNDTDGNINGSLTINTNLTVGSALNINGSILKLNSNVTGTPSQNMQITCERGTLYDSFILWNELDDKWYINDNTGIPREILHTGNITNLPSNSHNHNDLYYTKAETDLKDLFELNADGDIMPRA